MPSISAGPQVTVADHQLAGILCPLEPGTFGLVGAVQAVADADAFQGA